MKLKVVQRNKGLAFAIPSALIKTGVLPVEIGKSYIIEIKAE